MTTIGIDLGTSNSSVAYHNGQTWEIFEVNAGQTTIPSVVAVAKDGQFLVGHQAKRRLTSTDPRYVFSNIKRHIGLPYVDGEHYAQITKGENGERLFKGPDRNYSPEELSAEVLKVLKKAAEQRLGKKVKNAVITVPASFSNNQRLATEEAGRLAGFKRPIIKTEPEAAAVAFGVDQETYAKVVVFDFGGGTFDVVLMEAGRGDMEILRKDGWDSLGGIDFDKATLDELVRRYETDRGFDLKTKPVSIQRLMPLVEEAKQELSQVDATTIEKERAYYDDETGYGPDLNYELSRAEFEALTAHLVDDAMQITRRLLDEAGVSAREVHKVLLVGGMTHVPAVQKAVADMFGEKKIRMDVSQNLAVCMGAAMIAAEEDGVLKSRSRLKDVTPAAFGLEIEHGKFQQVIPKGAPYETLASVELTTTLDSQTVIPIAVLEGTSPKASENEVIGRYQVPVRTGLEKGPTVEVEFLVDGNGILLVSALDQDTGQRFEVLEAP